MFDKQNDAHTELNKFLSLVDLIRFLNTLNQITWCIV